MIDVKELKAGFSKGLGIAIGFFVIFGLALGVYAFVEPSSGPTTDFYFDSDSPLTSNSTLQFMGYTSALNGNRGGIEGPISECDSLYPGSRAATFEDIIKLGPLYNYTYTIWLMPPLQSLSGYCTQYSSTSSTSFGLRDTGTTYNQACSGALRFACVKGN